MKYVIILILFSFISGSALSQTTQKPSSSASANTNPWLKTDWEKAEKKPECMIDLKREVFLTNFNKFQQLIEKGNEKNEAIKTLHYQMFNNAVLGWTKLKYFECDTDISKAWLKKIADLFDKMYQCNKAMDICEARKDDKNFEVYKKVYNQLVDAYIKEIQKPEKPSNKITQELEKQKMKEQKAYKAYLKKTKGVEDDDDSSE